MGTFKTPLIPSNLASVGSSCVPGASKCVALVCCQSALLLRSFLERNSDAQGTIGFNTKIVIGDMDDLGAPLFKEHPYGSSPMTSYGNL